MKADDVKRLKELEIENSRLKRIVADQTLEVAALNEIAKGRMKVKSGPVPLGSCRRAASRRSFARRRPELVGRSGARSLGAAHG